MLFLGIYYGSQIYKNMPDQNANGDKVKLSSDKTPSCSKPHQGLFLKQDGAQMLSLLQVYHKVSSFFMSCFLKTHVLSSTG